MNLYKPMFYIYSIMKYSFIINHYFQQNYFEKYTVTICRFIKYNFILYLATYLMQIGKRVINLHIFSKSRRYIIFSENGKS